MKFSREEQYVKTHAKIAFLAEFKMKLSRSTLTCTFEGLLGEIFDMQVLSLDNTEFEHNIAFIVKTCLTEAPPRLSFILHVLNYQRLRVGSPRDN